MIQSPSLIVRRKCCYPHWTNPVKLIFAGAPGKYIWGIEVFMCWGIDVEVSLSRWWQLIIYRGIDVLRHSSTPRLYRRSCWKVIHLERWQLRYWHIGVYLYWSVLVLKCVFIDMLECVLYQGAKVVRKCGGSSAKFFSPNICYFVAILRFLTIYALFGRLWAKYVPFWVKNIVFLGKKFTITRHILHIVLN